MDIIKRRSIEKEKMKHLILNASIKIINKDGFDSLSMRKIADLIGYSPTTIYIYYENKAQIATDIGNEIFNSIINDISKLLSKQPDLTIEEKLTESFQQFIMSMTSHPEMGRAFIKSGTSGMFRGKTDDNQGENMLHSLLIEGYAQGIIKEVNDNSSWMILTALIGFGMNALENQLFLLDNWHNLIASFVDILMHGISK